MGVRDLALEVEWEYGPTLVFADGALSGLTQLSALYVRLSLREVPEWCALMSTG